jgi:uncharacterized membrane protein
MSLALSLIVHLVGIVVWVGGLMAMSRVMVVQAKIPGPARGVLAHLAGRLNIFALVGALLTIGSGLYQLSLWGMQVFRVTRWMHHKLTAILILLVLHGVMWSTQRKWEKLGPQDQLSRGRAAGLHGAVGLLLIAIVAIVFFGKLPPT